MRVGRYSCAGTRIGTRIRVGKQLTDLVAYDLGGPVVEGARVLVAP